MITAFTILIVFIWNFLNKPTKIEKKHESHNSQNDIAKTSKSGDPIEGFALFTEYCASCHNNDMVSDMTGPALGGITKRRNTTWLISFIQNSPEMIANGDSLAVKIFEEWDKSIMANFEMLSDKQVLSLLKYIEGY